MKIDRVIFNGFRSLANTSCNVAPKVVAFVGLNESGKSSVLDGLEWLTRPGEPPLAPADVYSGNEAVAGPRVAVRLKLSSDEAREAFDGLSTADRPRFFVYGRNQDGTEVFDFEPRPGRVLPEVAPLVAAIEQRIAAIELLTLQPSTRQEISRVRAAIRRAALNQDAGVTAADANVIRGLARFVRELRLHPNGRSVLPSESPAPNSHQAVDVDLSGELNRLVDLLEEEHPIIEAGRLLAGQVPRFLKVSIGERELASAHNFKDDASWSGLSPALNNLLVVAGETSESFRDVVERNQKDELMQKVVDWRENLRERMEIQWGDRRVSLDISVVGRAVTVSAAERKGTSDRVVQQVSLDWRSEGLRAFAALRACMLANNADSNTVLLIDEPETHLHYAAQALLVELFRGLDIQKVIYTTHSPGCLPRDLGTGIRLAHHKTARTSELSNHFWTSKSAGFDQLLYAMGAANAAFALQRYVVVAEGISEMIALPSLIRAATGAPSLDYVVGYGLASNKPGKYERLETLGGVVFYVADGDEDGRNYIADLKRSGIPSERRFGFRKGIALEDLVTWSTYHEALQEVLPPAVWNEVANLRSSDLPSPRASALESLLGDRAPGKKIVASVIVQLLDDAEVPRCLLTDRGAAELLRLHAQIDALVTRVKAAEEDR